MNVLSLIIHYLHWHYTRAFKEIFRAWQNILWFIKEFFSFKILLHTFFQPWKRLKEEGSGGIGGFFEGLVVTTIMRIVGMIMRTIVLMVGFFVWTFTVGAGIIFFGVWPFLPIIILFNFGAGVLAIFLEIMRV